MVGLTAEFRIIYQSIEGETVEIRRVTKFNQVVIDDVSQLPASFYISAYDTSNNESDAAEIVFNVVTSKSEGEDTNKSEGASSTSLDILLILVMTSLLALLRIRRYV